MLQAVIKRKEMYKIVDASEWTASDLEKFFKVYENRKDYQIQIRRVDT